MLKYAKWTVARGCNNEKGRGGTKCECWRLKNSLVQRNRSFSESASTAFVNDFRLQKQRKPNINADISMLSQEKNIKITDIYIRFLYRHYFYYILHVFTMFLTFPTAPSRQQSWQTVLETVDKMTTGNVSFLNGKSLFNFLYPKANLE